MTAPNRNGSVKVAVSSPRCWYWPAEAAHDSKPKRNAWYHDRAGRCVDHAFPATDPNPLNRALADFLTM